MAPILSRPAPERAATPAESALIEQLHALYVTLTRLPLVLTTARRGHWCAWLRHTARAGSELADLRLVLRYLVRQVDAEKRNAGCLKLQNLIMKPEQWEEDLAFALRAAKVRPRPAPELREERVPVIEPDGSAAVVARQVEHDAAAETPAEHIGSDLAAKLREFRESGMRKTPASTLPAVLTPGTASGDS